MTKTLEQVLHSVSDVLFPAEIGEAPVTVTSRSSEGDGALHVIAWRRDLVNDLQILTPMNRGGLGARSLNVELQ